jgi:predicted nucleic acid-binding Zn ribbon protein
MPLGFTPKWSFQTYCTDKCRHLSRTARRAVRRSKKDAPAANENQEPSPVRTQPAKSCFSCGREFASTWSFQFYCSESCRQRLKRKRRSERTQKAHAKAATFTAQHLLEQANTQRDKAEQPRLKPNLWLSCRAAVLEAEAQLQVWSARLQARKEKLSALEQPRLAREVHMMYEPEPLRVPEQAAEIGISASGSVAVVIYGKPKNRPPTD